MLTVADPMRVAIIGTGFGASVHLPAFSAHPGFEVAVLCGRNLDRTRAIAERAGVSQASNDFAAVVAVSTPPEMHAPVTLAAVAAGKQILCEKPMALTVRDARELAAAAEEAGIVGAMGFEWRYRSSRQHLRRLVRSGAAGAIRYVAVTTFVDYAANPTMEPYWYTWVSERRRAGGLLHGLLTHELDQIRHLFGDISGVQGLTTTALVDKPVLSFDYRDGDPLPPVSEALGTKTADADDGVAMFGRLPGGGLFSLASSWAVPGGSGTRLEIYGSEAAIFLDARNRIFIRRPDESVPTEVPLPDDLYVQGPEDNLKMFGGLVDDLWRSFAGVPDHKPEYATFRDGLAVQVIAEQVLGDITQ
jgi:predicted dehydrogenase